MANKCVCGWVSAPDPAWGAYSAPPDPLAGLRGPTSKWRGEGKGREGRGRRDGGCLTSTGWIKVPAGAYGIISRLLRRFCCGS